MFVSNKLTRVLLLQLLYSAVLAASLYAAFQLRFDFHAEPYLNRYELGLAISLGVTLPLLWMFGQFRSLLSYFGLPDAQRILFATALANGILLAVNYAHLGWLTPPRGVVLFNFIFSTVGLIGARLSIRILREINLGKSDNDHPKKRVGVYGGERQGQPWWKS